MSDPRSEAPVSRAEFEALKSRVAESAQLLAAIAATIEPTGRAMLAMAGVLDAAARRRPAEQANQPT